MNFIMHIIYTHVNTIYGYNWYVLFCYLLTAELSGIRIMSGANWKFAQRVMRIPLERFVAAVRISKQATIRQELQAFPNPPDMSRQQIAQALA
ncbi:MAG: hypothetical protein ACYDH8_06200 [Syntrophales bacterium]